MCSNGFFFGENIKTSINWYNDLVEQSGLALGDFREYDEDRDVQTAKVCSQDFTLCLLIAF